MLLFVTMMAYVAWWLIGSIRKRIVFEMEMEMALGVGSLWAAIFVPMLFDLPDLLPWPTALSLAGYALLWLGIGLFVVTILSLRRGGKPTSGWEETTELTTSGIHGLVRHPMQLSGILSLQHGCVATGAGRARPECRVRDLFCPGGADGGPVQPGQVRPAISRLHGTGAGPQPARRSLGPAAVSKATMRGRFA
jgi:hypothetical protein